MPRVAPPAHRGTPDASQGRRRTGFSSDGPPPNTRRRGTARRQPRCVPPQQKNLESKVMNDMELQCCINYLLTTAQHEVFQTFSGGLAQFNITPGQYGVLSCLWKNGSCTPKEIAQILRLENSTISGVLDRMQKRGLIDRVVDPNDRRSVQVVPTEEGSALRDDVLRVIDELNVEILAGFSPSQRSVLVECLRQIGKVDEGD